MALHISIASLLSICLNLIDSLDWESIGETAGNIVITLADVYADDPQAAMEPFGNIIIFLQSTIGRFKISPAAFVTSDRSISADDLMQVGNFQSTTELNEVELKAYEDWYKTLFDPSIDGVDESLVR